MDNLLDFAVNKFISIDYIATVGQWLIYLMNNKFVKGNQDDVLAEFDSLLKNATEFEDMVSYETEQNLLMYWKSRKTMIN